MDLLYKHKHHKPTKFKVKVKEFLRCLKIELTYDIEILKLDLKILKYNIWIGSEWFMDVILKLIEVHDNQWDRIDDTWMSYVEWRLERNFKNLEG